MLPVLSIEIGPHLALVLGALVCALAGIGGVVAGAWAAGRWLRPPPS